MSDHSELASLPAADLYDLVFHNSGDYAVIVSDLDGIIVAWNEGAQKVLGWNTEEAVGQSVDLFFTSEDRQAGTSTWEMHIAATKGRALDERWHVKRDGSYFWALGELMPLRRDGRLLGYSKILRDRTQERLVSERLRLTQEAGGIGSFEIFPEEGLISVSPQFCKIWGIAERNLYPIKQLLSLVHPDDRPNLLTDATALSAQALQYQEYRIFYGASAEERWIARRGEPIAVDNLHATRYLGLCYDITERKRAELAIRAAEARWRTLFEGMVDGFYVAQAIRDDRGNMTDFRYIEANPAFWVQLGLAPGVEVVGRTALDLLPDLSRAQLGIYEALLHSGERAHFEICLPGREQRWFEERARRLDGDRFAVAFIEVTRRREAELLLAQSEARFRAITHSIEQMVWTTSAQGTPEFFNDRWYDYTRASDVPASQNDWLRHVHPGDRKRVQKAWNCSLATGAPYHSEFRLNHRVAGYGWVLCRAHAVRAQNGAVTGWFLSATDIGEIVKARQILAQTKDDLQREVAEKTMQRDRVWRLSHDFMVVLSTDGTLLSINDACDNALGWGAYKQRGTSIIEAIHPEDRTRVMLELKRLHLGQSTTNFELRALNKVGAYRLVSWAAVAYEKEIYAIGRDITDLRETEERLRQTQKMDAIGQLTGGIAHDFNNMLTAILGSLELMKRHMEAGRTVNLGRYLDGATTSAHRAAALTQRLLSFSRRQPLELKPVSVNKLVVSLEDLMHRTLGEHYKLTTTLETGLPSALCDGNQLENALLNLVINARDAMPEGGAIEISTFLTLAEHISQAANAGLEPGEYIAVCVKDSGCGMPEDVQARAFEPFFTTKPAGKGTGLGLSMIYGYVKQAKGHVAITSKPGAGTHVCLYLPRSTPPPPAAMAG
ncbi:PAS domain S-box protein [Pseudomonas sp. RIT-PI-S]|uniref:PAS domain S-box protein n=1 Tax=Pseudomonas sp. RIT-PI-S TaxID=3035295 RepID=UPI0021D8D0FF|nr:PAS domain S-box protein [Pseudomonas sp. RIT-PI-S]